MTSSVFLLGIRAAKFITSFLMCFLFLSILDTAVYDGKVINDFLQSKPFVNSRSVLKLVTSLTITPMNNIIYNIQRGNLESHGLHPVYTHLVVNLPMICGPLLVPFILTCKSIIVQIRNQVTLQVDKYVMLQLLGTFFVSLSLLSVTTCSSPSPNS